MVHPSRLWIALSPNASCPNACPIQLELRGHCELASISESTFHWERRASTEAVEVKLCTLHVRHFVWRRELCKTVGGQFQPGQ